ncbi:uncharacterized protein TRAVEDRAFT_22568 [Trametes versicolor FP-101664 SS1]|uniref:uncharacterized protein n=1 Tax=Trametes versicolor (strain FP-101664) TaxID=717944 RepID=UPI0004623317|nr:uncharacterized protein TRAVEDRAFT_22568 [Trametes versicolor FP-101664 SS1]EIW54630.1 hypothetical protein TRAVEDRAFT_22568 [Trametes versicolor FP-101664 SS1]
MLHVFRGPSISFHPVRLLRLDIVQSPPIWAFTNALASRPYASECMEMIGLTLGRLSNEPFVEGGLPVYLGGQLAPLFALSALRFLSIRGHCHVLVDDDTLESISRAWPKLAFLNFEPARRSKDAFVARPPKPHLQGQHATLSGLLHLSERCHELRFLGLVLEIAALLPTAEVRRALAAQEMPCPLRTLSVGWAPLVDPIPSDEHMLRLASALSALFPNLTTIQDAWDQPVFDQEMWQAVKHEVHNYRASTASRFKHEQWQRVADRVPQFAKVRGQERAWRAAQSAARETDCNGQGLNPSPKPLNVECNRMFITPRRFRTGARSILGRSPLVLLSSVDKGKRPQGSSAVNYCSSLIAGVPRAVTMRDRHGNQADDDDDASDAGSPSGD